MIHFIIINLFYWSGVWILNISRVRFNWKFWRVNLNITIINGMMIKSSHDSWNNRAGFGRGGPIFEVKWWKLAVTLSWYLSWLFTSKGVEWINISSKTWWEEFRAMNDSGISLLSNPSKGFSNTLLSKVERFNNWLESCCIIVNGRQSTKNYESADLKWSISLDIQ